MLSGCEKNVGSLNRGGGAPGGGAPLCLIGLPSAAARPGASHCLSLAQETRGPPLGVGDDLAAFASIIYAFVTWLT